MFAGITSERLLAMTEQEQRWLDNVKKAFFESDSAYLDGRSHDQCFPALCKAIDTAKTLRRSLHDEDTSSRENKKRFIEFLDLEIPSAETGGMRMPLRDARTGEQKDYSFAALVYDIRCMIHENENLNAAEAPNYHILIDWTPADSAFFGTVSNGQLVCNGYTVWHRLRQVVAKFITGIDGMVAMAKGQPSHITITPPLGSIRPPTPNGNIVPYTGKPAGSSRS